MMENNINAPFYYFGGHAIEIVHFTTHNPVHIMGTSTIVNNNNNNNVGQSSVNLSMLAQPYARILLVQGGVYSLPCDGWLLVFLFFPALILPT